MMENMHPLINLFIALLLSPLLLGLINKTKAFFFGRQGLPWLQLYFDLAKLLRKGAVYSKTTGWMFRLGPVASLACVLTALLLLPWGATAPVFSFPGDIIVFVYLLASQRFFMVLAALDTGSSFEGMGASRDIQFSVFSELALFLSLAVMASAAGSVSISGLLSGAGIKMWQGSAPSAILVSAVLFIVLLAENYRVPFDDPNTHLELTMIHEVMALDHGGIDLALIDYAGALKFWLLSSVLAGFMNINYGAEYWMNVLGYCGIMALIAFVCGVVESGLARLRLVKIPQLLIAAAALSLVAFIFQTR